MWRRERAFTLIELLIVIAIILILIAIALPNFLEAQIRAKVANVSAELKTIETAVTSYRLERGFDPADGTTLGGAGYVAGSEGNPFVWSQLTTPVQYLTSIPIDEFLPADYAVDGGGNGSGVRDPNNNVYRYYAAGWRCQAAGFSLIEPRRLECRVNPAIRGQIYSHPFDPDKGFLGSWIALSAGPDQSHGYGEWELRVTAQSNGYPRTYSPTNGTRSYGDIVQTGGG